MDPESVDACLLAVKPEAKEVCMSVVGDKLAEGGRVLGLRSVMIWSGALRLFSCP
jgi:hypothetical protein